tara:strand:+ start:2043 stop:2315 length:273 start_codon:yes stop_codon:yes gene_type:complete
MNTNILNNDNNKLELLEKKIENLEQKIHLLENIIMQNSIKNFDLDFQQVIPNTELNFDNENINRSINMSENNFIDSPPNLERQYGFGPNN